MRVRKVRVLLDGKRVPVRRRGKRLVAVIDLRGRPAGKQTLRVASRQPATFFRDADRRHIKFVTVDCLQNGSRGK